MQRYETALAGVFTGREADITEENLQARIRGTLLMALSNKFGSIVLTILVWIIGYGAMR